MYKLTMSSIAKKVKDTLEDVKDKAVGTLEHTRKNKNIL